MSTALHELVGHCDALLDSARFKDYCPNGLQVEGRGEVRRLATAVTASQAVLEAAIAWEADALLVHHGYFWRGEDAPVVGMKRRRLATLLEANLSLIAYHLPLDAHPELGNNAQWGVRLGLPPGLPLDPTDSTQVGNIAALDEALQLGALMDRVEGLTARRPLLIGDPERSVGSIAWCTGAAQGYIEQAAAAGADLYISGEISEQTVHQARELNIAYLAAGHHATERYGVQALGASLAETFGLDWVFLDEDNPV